MIMPTSNAELPPTTLVTVSVVEEMEPLPAAPLFGEIKTETNLEFSSSLAQCRAVATPAKGVTGILGGLGSGVESQWV
jgi:hypothetical protein